MTQEAPAEGAVFYIDLADGNPPHYFMVLNPPRFDGLFLLVGFTDRHNVLQKTDVWELGYKVTQEFKLAKPSVLALRFARIETISFFESRPQVGAATPEALQRARCNLFWHEHLLRPKIKAFRNFYLGAWDQDCGPSPQFGE